MESTPLSTILNRIDSFQDLSGTEAQFKVRFLDAALRKYRRETQLPWMLIQGTLRVFDNVLVYPVPAGFDEIGYLENNQGIDNKYNNYGNRARFKFTSLQQFYENPDVRNNMAEIWDQGTKFLGVRYKDTNLGSVKLNSAETVADWTASGDASNPTLDNVFYKEGNGSIKITIVNSTGSAVIKNVNTSLNDSLYKQKYEFRDIYLDGVPTSIELRLQTDDSNYLTTTVTSQFSGQAFKADAWNTVAIDLNEATEVGTFDSSSIASEKMILTGAPSGTYYVDASYMRKWRPFDFWYYSSYQVKTLGNNVASQEYFMNSSEVYSSDSELVAPSEFIDVIMYEAMIMAAMDQKKKSLVERFLQMGAEAELSLYRQYPSMMPLITTNRWRFNFETSNYNDNGYGYRH